MAKLDQKTERTIQGFVSQIEEIYKDNLVSIILYGSAAGVDYIPEVSDLNFIVALKQVTPEQLKKSSKYIKRWRKQKIAPPLFLDQQYISSSTDVFPIEFLEMKEQHRVLAGGDILKGLEISDENLRLQCEQELRGKWLKLRQIYLETGGNAKRMQRLMVSSLKPFGVVMGALLRLKKEKQPPREFLEVVYQIEQAFGIELEAFREIYQVKLASRKLGRDASESLFARYLTEVRQLTQEADALLSKVK